MKFKLTGAIFINALENSILLSLRDRKSERIRGSTIPPTRLLRAVYLIRHWITIIYKDYLPVKDVFFAAITVNEFESATHDEMLLRVLIASRASRGPFDLTWVAY